MAAAAGFSASEEDRLQHHRYLFLSRCCADGDRSIPNGRSLDGEFHRRMNERDEHAPG